MPLPTIQPPNYRAASSPVTRTNNTGTWDLPSTLGFTLPDQNASMFPRPCVASTIKFARARSSALRIAGATSPRATFAVIGISSASKPAAMKQGNAVTYPHGDNLGSTNVVSTNAGAFYLRQTRGAYAFGVPRTTEGTLPTDYTFPE